MSKVTSKLQVTIPKAIATKFDIRPGTELEFVDRGGTLGIVATNGTSREAPIEERLRLFDEATRRQQARNRTWKGPRHPKSRGWTREDLYGDRGRPR